MQGWKLDAIAAAIEEYDAALTRREHGGVAMDKAFGKIREVVAAAAPEAPGELPDERARFEAWLRSPGANEGDTSVSYESYHVNAMWVAWQARAAVAAALAAPGEPVVRQDVIDFLCGAAPLEGVWFGERHPTRKGAFWWRKLLPPFTPSSVEQP